MKTFARVVNPALKGLSLLVLTVALRCGNLLVVRHYSDNVNHNLLSQLQTLVASTNEYCVLSYIYNSSYNKANIPKHTKFQRKIEDSDKTHLDTFGWEA